MIAVQGKDWDAEPGEENVVILADKETDALLWLRTEAGDHVDGIRFARVIDIRKTQPEIDLETASHISDDAWADDGGAWND